MAVAEIYNTFPGELVFISEEDHHGKSGSSTQWCKNHMQKLTHSVMVVAVDYAEYAGQFSHPH